MDKNSHCSSVQTATCVAWSRGIRRDWRRSIEQAEHSGYCRVDGTPSGPGERKAQSSLHNNDEWSARLVEAGRMIGAPCVSKTRRPKKPVHLVCTLEPLTDRITNAVLCRVAHKSSNNPMVERSRSQKIRATLSSTYSASSLSFMSISFMQFCLLTDTLHSSACLQLLRVDT